MRFKHVAIGHVDNRVFMRYSRVFWVEAIAVFKKRDYRAFVFFYFLFLLLTMAAFKKCGSSLPKAAFYRCSFKFSLYPRV